MYCLGTGNNNQLHINTLKVVPGVLNLLFTHFKVHADVSYALHTTYRTDLARFFAWKIPISVNKGALVSTATTCPEILGFC